MKKYFITGLVILLPVALTIAIVLFVFNLLTVPLSGIVTSFFNRYHLFEDGFLFLSSDQLQQLISQLLVLVIIFFFTVLLGVIARNVFSHYFISLGESILHRIPMVNTIYKTSKDVVKTMFTSSAKSFKQVVLVPFPSAKVYSIGLITREDLPSVDPLHSTKIAVFVPTTPNPTSGFMMLYSPDEIHYLDMSVENAFKFVVSCGVIPMPFKIISREEALKKNASPETGVIK
jgi:uncharacterized membrane protein